MFFFLFTSNYKNIILSRTYFEKKIGFSQPNNPLPYFKDLICVILIRLAWSNFLRNFM